VQLREQQQAVEAMVEQVVDVHHNGFNKSIQNYSQVLRLFTESTVSRLSA
jgi:exocyst complex component 4